MSMILLKIAPELLIMPEDGPVEAVLGVKGAGLADCHVSLYRF